MKISRNLDEVEEYVRLHGLAVQTARVTGRAIFGQLWYSDPTMDDILRAVYVRLVGVAMNRNCALKEWFDAQ